MKYPVVKSTFALSTASAISALSPAVMPSGFSAYMCFPAAAAARTSSRCLFVSEQITTATTSGSDQICRRSVATAAPSSAARLAARAGIVVPDELDADGGPIAGEELYEAGRVDVRTPDEARASRAPRCQPPGRPGRPAAPL